MAQILKGACNIRQSRRILGLVVPWTNSGTRNLAREDKKQK